MNNTASTDFILMSSDPIRQFHLNKIGELDCDIIWKIPLFSFIGIRVPYYSISGLKYEVEEYDWVLGLEPERVHEDPEDQEYDPGTATFSPEFDWEESMERTGSRFEIEDIDADGSGAKAAVIDSGIDTNNSQINKVDGRFNFTDSETIDDTGHGTLVAHILQKSAPKSDIYDFKVVSSDCLKESDVIKALNKCVKENIHVANVSLGFRNHEKRDPCPVCTAANYAAALGTFVCAAAGNHASKEFPHPEPTCPANASEVLSVGSIDGHGEIQEYSPKANVHHQDTWNIDD